MPEAACRTGRITTWSLLYYLLSMVLAVCLGIALSYAIKPGRDQPFCLSWQHPVLHRLRSRCCSVRPSSLPCCPALYRTMPLDMHARLPSRRQTASVRALQMAAASDTLKQDSSQQII